MVVEGLCWGSPAEGLAGSAVEGRSDGGEVAGGVLAQVSAFGEVLPQQVVGVLVGAALLGAVRVAEVDRQPGVDPQLRVLGHLGALVPGQGTAQLVGQPGRPVGAPGAGMDRPDPAEQRLVVAVAPRAGFDRPDPATVTMLCDEPHDRRRVGSVEVGPRRGSGLVTGPFPRAASRTRRAPFNAPGSPQARWGCVLFPVRRPAAKATG